MEQIDAVLGVARHNLVTLDVLQIVHKDFVGEHVDQALYVVGHLILVISLNQLAKVVVGES